MAAPERFAETSDSFPLHRGRRPYMTQKSGHPPKGWQPSMKKDAPAATSGHPSFGLR
jgi:hypothetical protein